MEITKEMNDFIDFITERERIRLRRRAGESAPWTDDIVLQKTKFTNIDRNDDYGTKTLFNFVRGMKPHEKIFYTVFYRCLYSVRPFFTQMTGDFDIDWNKIVTDGLTVGARLPYQIYLNKGQSINDFLRSTAFDVFLRTSTMLTTFNKASIKEMTDVIAGYFKFTHGKNMIFLASEISKDLSLLFPEHVDPLSKCYFNIGAVKGLKIVKADIYSLFEATSLTYSQLEHALCEYSKYVKRKIFYEENGHFLHVWIYHGGRNR